MFCSFDAETANRNGGLGSEVGSPSRGLEIPNHPHSRRESYLYRFDNNFALSPKFLSRPSSSNSNEQ